MDRRHAPARNNACLRSGAREAIGGTGRALDGGCGIDESRSGDDSRSDNGSRSGGAHSNASGTHASGTGDVEDGEGTAGRKFRTGSASAASAGGRRAATRAKRAAATRANRAVTTRAKRAAACRASAAAADRREKTRDAERDRELGRSEIEERCDAVSRSAIAASAEFERPAATRFVVSGVPLHRFADEGTAVIDRKRRRCGSLGATEYPGSRAIDRRIVAGAARIARRGGQVG